MNRKKRGQLFVKVRRCLFIGLVLILSLIGCSKEAPITEQIYEHLEKSVELESDYAEYQEEILELEQKEQNFYDEITDLSSDEIEKIKLLASEAMEVINEREELIEKEKERIDASKEEFSKVERDRK